MKGIYSQVVQAITDRHLQCSSVAIVGVTAMLTLLGASAEVYAAQRRDIVNEKSTEVSEVGAAAHMHKDEIEKRASDLHKEIQNNYQIWVKYAVPNGKGVDISSVIEKTIPEGTSFDDAAIILRKAGFELSPLPPQPSSPPPWKEEDRFNIYGRVQLDSSFGTKTLLTVVVIQKSTDASDLRSKTILALIHVTTF